jgi:hypothetical protein
VLIAAFPLVFLPGFSITAFHVKLFSWQAEVI